MCSRLEIAQNGMLGETRAEDTKISISCILTVGGYYFTLIAVGALSVSQPKGIAELETRLGLNQTRSALARMCLRWATRRPTLIGVSEDTRNRRPVTTKRAADLAAPESRNRSIRIDRFPYPDEAFSLPL